MHPFIIFIISLLVSAAFLFVERSVGIGVDFHPDSNTYLTRGNLFYAIALNDPRIALNHGYYLFSALVNESATALISINIFVYALTNTIIHAAYKSALKDAYPNRTVTIAFSFCYYLVLFNLYRLHLSVHVLKDTLLVFFVVAMIVSGMRKGLIFLPFILVIRLFGIAYYFLPLRGRTLMIGLAVVLPIALVGGQFDQATSFLLDWNEKDLNFREGAQVPSFQDMGMIGVLLRMFVWPLLMLSGLFLVLSPSAIFIPIALGSVLMQIWALVVMKRFAFLLSAFGLMALIAALVPGFTTYQRYCLPILVVMPILMLRAKALSDKAFLK